MVGLSDVLPNTRTLSGVFAAASNLADVFGGQRGHALAIKLASLDDVFVGSSLLIMHCKSGFVSEGRKVFDEMPERNPVSWATMISGYADERMAKEALNVFEMMGREEEGFEKYVFTSVLSALADPQFVDIGRQIHCLAVKNGLFVVVSVLNALVTMYAKCRSLDDCLQVFQLSSDKDAITWSAIVTGYAQNGDSRKALQLFSKMHFTGIDPNARKRFDYLEEHDIVLWTSMITGYVQDGENEEALSLYGRMLLEGIQSQAESLAQHTAPVRHPEGPIPPGDSAFESFEHAILVSPCHGLVREAAIAPDQLCQVSCTIPH
ncbi:hypothetical protein Tsubulata_029229 [Turnera subulata]|uniref:Pentatricopeptide repeat-containing protein n=1 Tax=Turnera subulata TaxID=218843 RepID=A0A9Q0FQH5_9ROSI|nr:hypothetical protein Tsubulata_029229 [Turnera subulata]